MLRARPQVAPRATNTHRDSPPSSMPQEHPRPSLINRINQILLASTCTNTLEATELCCLVTDTVSALQDTKQLIATLTPRLATTKSTNTKSLLSQVWDDIQQIKQSQGAPASTGSSVRSWVSIAALQPQAIRPQNHVTTTKSMACQMQELKIRFTKQSEQQTVLSISNQDMLVQINLHFPISTKAVGIKRLLSGNLVIQTIYKEAKKTVNNNQKWLVDLGKSGAILQDRFAIFVHLVQVDYIDIDKTKAKQYIQAENKSLYLDLRVVQITWPKSVIANQKRYSSLILEVDSLEQANKLIQNRLYKKGEIKHYKLFESGCKLTQCYKCQHYSHIARACRGVVQCTYCAKGHAVKDCLYKEGQEATDKKCANCG